VSLLRPWFWPVSWGPAGFGVVLATERWVPAVETLPRTVLAFLVLGPLVWGCVLLANDPHDLVSDRLNPRKAGTPLVRGAVAASSVDRARTGLAVASVVLALLVSPLFGLGTALVLALGWAYSCPPLRLKSRPGADVTVNALAVGVLAPLGGWSLYRPVLDYPPTLLVLGLLVGAALYLPTTVLDLRADAAAGDRTFAVRFGGRTAYLVGLVCWCAAVAGWLVWCRLSDLLSPAQVDLQVVLCLILVPLYAVLAARPSIPRLAVVSGGFVGPAVAFMAGLVG
jgi:chlorophyll synthase